MSVLRVRLVGDEALRTRAKEVSSVKRHQQLIDDMLATVNASEKAVALAAPQVGYSWRIFVFAQDRFHPKVFINPVIESWQGLMEVPEGCLSIPDFYPMIRRNIRVQGTALDRWGVKFDFDETDLLGHAAQHELDHLNGTLMFDRMSRADRDELLQRLPLELHPVRKGVRKLLKELNAVPEAKNRMIG